ncbi:MAG TPA: Crp/Fnr family transcriptional regulator [Bacteroidetes bacterium]|nr:cAMP receptor protein [bacterium BMS3Bbin03]HDK35861.1 Crp/Fnr family transcriptional regulator [Bacteroidota bacterium]
MDKIWYLKKINIFAGLTDDEMDYIDRVSVMKHYSKKEPIFLSRDPGDRVYLLKKGKVKIARLSVEGKELILAVLHSGEIFGEAALFDANSRENMAETLEDAFICEINKRDFEVLLAKKPELVLRLTKLIGFRRRQLEMKIEDLIFKNVKARLARLLLNLSRTYGIKKPSGILINIKLTHSEIANLIGASRETTTIYLNHFKQDGLIDFQKRKIILLASDKLQKKVDVGE